ncbi:hypothetical protein TWF788_007457 [Orbilia oligospora]|uniref:Uncharacterized protein n=1 Tax=Orbilia oligospora TaxID=2813651 RepID=A0A7C8U474_ORBOL|nr:hypothetical protein TWF788_007457 [Orbilia oligospora]
MQPQDKGIFKGVFEKATMGECNYRTDGLRVHNIAQSVIEGEDVLVSLHGDIQVTEKYATIGLDPLYEDENGWNKNHMEAVYNGAWNELTKTASSVGLLTNPSRLEWHWEAGKGAKLDSDKPTIRSSNDKPSETDNFVFPALSRFYFKATFTAKPLRARTEECSLHPSIHGQWLYDNSYLKAYWSPASGLFYNEEDWPGAEVFIERWESYGYPLIAEGVVGFGFGYPTGKIYLTRDGRLVGTICKVSKRAPWRPSIGWSCVGLVEMSSNFCSRRFEFLGWEAPIEEIEAMYETKKGEEITTPGRGRMVKA